MEENQNYFFTICAWPNWHVRAKILPRFQFEGKTDVWISQVRRVNKLFLKVDLNSHPIVHFENTSTSIWKWPGFFMILRTSSESNPKWTLLYIEMSALPNMGPEIAWLLLSILLQPLFCLVHICQVSLIY